jgi:CBS domain-containing protein
MGRCVRDVMHREFIRVAPEESVLAVLQLMSMARVRVLPVVEGDQMRGLVAHRDLVAAILGLTGEAVDAAEPVVDFARPVAAVSPEAPLLEAARRMIEEAVPCLVVTLEIDGRPRVVGLITEGDLLREAYWRGLRRNPIRAR